MDADDIRRRVAEAAAAGDCLEIRGGGSKAFLGRRVSDAQPLEVAGCRGIVAYDPSELVVTVRGGTPIVELETTLAASGQMLPFEPPRHSPGATVGGTVAAGLSGPRRAWAGSVRDFVLGVECVSGRGERLRFGGRVMKNVAGYDASRLMVGAMGTLGVVTEVSFKVLPVPECETTRVLEMDAGESLNWLARAGATPLPLSASCHHDGRLHVRLSGTGQGVDAGVARVGGEPLEDAGAFWDGLRDQTHPFFAGDAELWRLSLPPAAAFRHDAPLLIEWGGAQRWLRGPADGELVRELARDAGGSATLFRNGDRSGDVYPALDPVLHRLHESLKDGFDPGRVLNPGRLYRDL